eukprot:1759638-Rhodomonas_salina.1
MRKAFQGKSGKRQSARGHSKNTRHKIEIRSASAETVQMEAPIPRSRRTRHPVGKCLKYLPPDHIYGHPLDPGQSSDL